ncbi:protein kri1-like [Venturia nashicola]|nr:protein kri1-like [Venturia nashicola]
MAERPAKRTKLLSDSDSDSSDNEGVKLPKQKKSSMKAEFKINDEFAKRFEHNNKRADLQRLEEKYGKGGSEEESDESSTDESEDDDADLVTADLDEEIFATLNAIKNKDPRVYDEKVKFYKEFDPEKIAKEEKKDKAMTLQDYHRQNLLSGYTGEEEEEKKVPQTYNQEQDELRRKMVGQMHAMADEDSEDDFKPKAKGAHDSVAATKSKKAKKLTEEDIAAAEKDPETYLSNFMAAQAWRPTEGSGPNAFDSDDSEDEARADAFEEAYNMRFEDPALANEKLQTFARDVGKYSVRREETKGRKSAREKERERKDAEKREREEDRARLRRLKIEEAEEKVKKIKEAAGLRGKDVDITQWQDVIEGDFDDSQWDKEMQRRFGEDYYAVPEAQDSDVEMADGESKKHKVKKPKWDDDIDINDLVPEFEAEEARKYALSSDDEEDGGAPLDAEEDEEDEQEGDGKKRKTKKDRLKEKAEAKRASRKERRAIEEMVDATLPIAHAPVTGFRYRETSPTSFGLSARDILFADDTALNQFAGLKKMATWRDPERKAREAKKLSKKGRLRQWRKDTFGKPDAPEGGFEVVLGRGEAGEAEPKSKKGEDGNVKDGDRKKKRSKKRKAKEVEA